MEVKITINQNDPLKFIDAVAKAGYATDPCYAHTLESVVKTIEQYTG